MKTRLILLILLAGVLFTASCRHRDCRGNKHKIKTDMGGYL